MMRYLIILNSFLFAYSSFAQDSYWEKKQSKADTLITDMKSSVLLIQLNAENPKSRSKYNRPNSHPIVTNSFRADFNFCKVLFYNEVDSSKVFSNQLSKVTFFNSSLEPIVSDTLINYATYIGVFGRIEEDPSRNFDGYYYVEGPNGKEKRARYAEESEIGFNALVLYDSIGVQLPRPLPFYVRTFDSGLFKRNPITVIKKMNAKLDSYYRKRALIKA